MIRLGRNSPCEECDHFKGVKQPNGDESEEYFYCTQFKKIPVEIVLGKRQCKKQKNDD